MASGARPRATIALVRGVKPPGPGRSVDRLPRAVGVGTLGLALSVATLVSACEREALVAAPRTGFFRPETVEFGEVAVGQVSRSVTDFSNTSGRRLLVRSVRFEPNRDVFGAFLVRGGTLNGASIPRGGAVGVEVRFGPRSAGTFDGLMVVEADELTVSVPIMARARVERPAQLDVNPPSIHFSTVGVGEAVARGFELTNTGDESGNVVSVSVGAGAFRVSRPGAEPLALPIALRPGESTSLEATYQPLETNALDDTAATLRLDSGASAKLRLSGNSADLRPSVRCTPTSLAFGTVARGGTAERAIRCERLDEGWSFQGAALSEDGAPDFEVASTRVQPNGDADITVGLRAAGPVGHQRGRLEVIGTGASASVALTATIAPPAPGAADIDLRLTWNTPFSDFDLHVVRDGGTPFSTIDDCFFASKNPDWGIPGSPNDDPFLDRDDREGYGPEHISVLRAAEQRFDVYVQYHDFTRGRVEPTTVNLRWRLRSGDQGTLRRDLLACGDWWHVGSVELGPPLRFLSVDRLSQAYRSRAAERCR